MQRSYRVAINKMYLLNGNITFKDNTETMDKQIECQTDRQTIRQTRGQTDRRLDRHGVKQTDDQTEVS